MGIQFNARTQTFTLQTIHTTYQMRVDERGRLLHMYYGRKIGRGDLRELYPPADHGFSPRITRLGLPDNFVEHGTVDELRRITGIDTDSITAAIIEAAGA